MKSNVVFIGLLGLVMLCGCSSTVTFPISTVDPSAVITVQKRKDPNNNFIINLTATNVVSPDRLTPPAKTYVVWIVTKDKEVKNAGQFGSKKSSKYRISATSATDVKEVFITAEEDATTAFPVGLEISRASLK